MPPKKAAKAVEKSKAKVAEDKTFGLKNKNKSSKVQKYVQQVNAQSKPQQQTQGPSAKDKRKAEEEAAKEMAALFATAIKQPRVPPGVDPKSIVCEFYRAGQCTKGFKCKFSHDLAVERKGGKADIYSDQRSAEEEDGGMEDWDQETLEKAVAEKHAKDNTNRATAIVCRYFLDAVEKRQYGWFWTCPNGKDCKYRHALPPGYVLKSQMKQLLEEEAANAKSVEEIIEEERANVDAKTPITDDVFKVWKAAQEETRRKKMEEALEERRRRGILTGREIFAQEGFVAADDVSASDAYTREVDDEAEIKRIEAEANAAQQAARDLEDSAAAAAATTEASQPPQPAVSLDEAAPKVTLTAKEEEELFDDDDEDSDDDLLDEMAAGLSKSVALAE